MAPADVTTRQPVNLNITTLWSVKLLCMNSVHLEVLGEVVFPREEVVVPLELCMLDPDNTVMVMS